MHLHKHMVCKLISIIGVLIKSPLDCGGGLNLNWMAGMDDSVEGKTIWRNYFIMPVNHELNDRNADMTALYRWLSARLQ